MRGAPWEQPLGSLVGWGNHPISIVYWLDAQSPPQAQP